MSHDIGQYSGDDKDNVLIFDKEYFEGDMNNDINIKNDHDEDMDKYD